MAIILRQFIQTTTTRPYDISPISSMTGDNDFIALCVLFRMFSATKYSGDDDIYFAVRLAG